MRQRNKAGQGFRREPICLDLPFMPARPTEQREHFWAVGHLDTDGAGLTRRTDGWRHRFLAGVLGAFSRPPRV